LKREKVQEEVVHNLEEREREREFRREVELKPRESVEE
jgi:hypothetical protein